MASSLTIGREARSFLVLQKKRPSILRVLGYPDGQGGPALVTGPGTSNKLRILGDCAQTAAACSSRGGCGLLVTMADTDETKPDVGNLEHVNIKVKSQVRGLFLEQHTYRVATSPAVSSTLPVLCVV